MYLNRFLKLGKVFFIIGSFLSISIAEDTKLETAPDFTAKTLKGENFSLSGNLSKGPIVINFWATWCGPCILEMKNMKDLHSKYAAKGLHIISISIDDNKSQSQIPGIIRSYKFPYTILLDPNKDVYKLFHVANVPEIFIIDKSGKIVYHHQGYQKGDEKKTEEIVANLIAKDK